MPRDVVELAPYVGCLGCVRLCVCTMSSLCSANTSSECHSCLLTSVETLCSNEAETWEKTGDVGFDDDGVAAAEDGRDVDMVECKRQLVSRRDQQRGRKR